LTEAELIQGCKNKISSHQRLLFERYAGKMMSVCLRYANDQHTAQEILQTGFIKLFDKIHQFRGEGSFEGWMKRVFVTVALRELSKRKINFREIGDMETNAVTQDPSVFSKISEEDIHAMIKKLPDGYRTVFNMHIIEGYSHDEIASLLNIQATTSRTQLLKARKMLQGLISKSFNLITI
jgi:RNA polymerase sigma-70 factor (ECF subfamily)